MNVQNCKYMLISNTLVLETRPSCSHELATFLNYHMPLKRLKFLKIIFNSVHVHFGKSD